MKTLVLGASTNSARYSFMATQLLRSKGHEVVAVGKSEGSVGDVPIVHDFPPVKDIDTITLYLNPLHQEKYYDQILNAQPRRIIFNPGAENETLRKMAEEKGILTEIACTLVLLNTGQY
ncbi:MAG: CoA-binding protein [Bacteroidetes bacterium]|nr:CoA-binding protein [Bacteroidota bacterium]